MEWGNRSLNRSSDTAPTSPFAWSGRTSRVDTGALSSFLLLARLFRSEGTAMAAEEPSDAAMSRSVSALVVAGGDAGRHGAHVDVDVDSGAGWYRCEGGIGFGEERGGGGLA